MVGYSVLHLLFCRLVSLIVLLCVCLSVCLSVCVCVSSDGGLLSATSTALSSGISDCTAVCVSVCMSVCLCLCVQWRWVTQCYIYCPVVWYPSVSGVCNVHLSLSLRHGSGFVRQVVTVSTSVITVLNIQHVKLCSYSCNVRCWLCQWDLQSVNTYFSNTKNCLVVV